MQDMGRMQNKVEAIKNAGKNAGSAAPAPLPLASPGSRKRLLRVLALFAVVSATFLFLPSATTSLQAQESKPVANQDFVSITLPYPIDFVHERMMAQFDSESRNYFEDYNRAIYELPEKVLTYKELSPKAYEQFMALPLAKPTKFYVFFGAYSVMQRVLSNITPVNVIGLTNPALVRYASLPMAERSYDIYVWSPDTPYWHSEYSLNKVKLPFRSYFIFHLAAVDATHTRIEAIEHKPVVRISGKPSVDENGKLQDFELREVAPTTTDRTFLLSCVQQFIERQVPERSKFNCRDGTEPPPVQWSNP